MPASSFLMRMAAAAVARGWTPAQIGGAALYFNADDLTGGSGAAVASWTDRLAGQTISQATGTAQPTIVTAAGSTTHQALRFTSASAQYLAGSPVAAIPTTGPFWVWTVHYKASNPSPQPMMLELATPGQGTGGVGWGCWLDVGFQVYGKAHLNPSGAAGDSLSVNVWRQWEFDPVTAKQLYTDRNNLNGPVLTTYSTQPSTGATTFTLGGSQAQNSNWMDIDLFIVLIGTGTPSASDKLKFGVWLDTNYGIQCGTGYNSPSAAVPALFTNAGGAVSDCVELGVVYNPSGVFGHKYWLAAAPYDTGFPDENPNVNYSDDGNTWVSIGTAPIANPTANTPTTSTTGGSIPASTTRYYKVTAVNAIGETLGSNEVTIATGAGTSTNSNTVTWAAVTGASTYNIYASTTSGTETQQATGITGTTWTDTAASLVAGAALPTGNKTGTNPLVVKPANANHSDPSIFDNTARDSKMYVTYTVERSSGGPANGLYMAESSDGTTWTDLGFVTSGDFECPVMCYDSTSGEYWLYSIGINAGPPNIIGRQSSTSPASGYGAVTNCTLTIPNGTQPWHISAPIKIGSKWVFVFSDSLSTGRQLWLASSTDGLTWTCMSTPLVVPGYEGWDLYTHGIYRGAIQDAGDGVNLLLWYISGTGGSGTNTNYMSQMVTVPQSVIP